MNGSGMSQVKREAKTHQQRLMPVLEPNLKEENRFDHLPFSVPHANTEKVKSLFYHQSRIYFRHTYLYCSRQRLSLHSTITSTAHLAPLGTQYHSLQQQPTPRHLHSSARAVSQRAPRTDCDTLRHAPNPRCAHPQPCNACFYGLCTTPYLVSVPFLPTVPTDLRRAGTRYCARRLRMRNYARQRER